MNYKQMKNELKKLKVNDLDSAIKYELLTRWIYLLVNSNRQHTHTINILNDNNLYNIISYIKVRLNYLIDESEDMYIRISKINKKENV